MCCACKQKWSWTSQNLVRCIKNGFTSSSFCISVSWFGPFFFIMQMDTRWMILMTLNVSWFKLSYYKILYTFWFIMIDENQNIEYINDWIQDCFYFILVNIYIKIFVPLNMGTTLKKVEILRTNQLCRWSSFCLRILEFGKGVKIPTTTLIIRTCEISMLFGC